MSGERQAKWRALKERRAALVAEFLAVFPQTPRYALRKGEDVYLATRNIGEAPWRLTHFVDGEPVGHAEYGTLDGTSPINSLAQAIWELRVRGFEP